LGESRNPGSTFSHRPHHLILILISNFVINCHFVSNVADFIANSDSRKRKPEDDGPRIVEESIVPARGVQIYECRTKKDQADAYAWAFVAPEADLFDTSGKKIGKHYAGPHWESTDGSKVAGTVKERADAPQADAIPWLLLVTKSVGAEGSFSKITGIQRVNTVGGVEPKTACSQSTVGTTARVPYTADYYFLTEK
jgi:hypothetical protein